MAKKRKKSKAIWPDRGAIEHASAYVTFGRKVYLGRCHFRVRSRAYEAGLIPVTMREMRRAMIGLQAIQRIDRMGEWYDTVKY